MRGLLRRLFGRSFDTDAKMPSTRIGDPVRDEDIGYELRRTKSDIHYIQQRLERIEINMALLMDHFGIKIQNKWIVTEKGKDKISDKKYPSGISEQTLVDRPY